MALFEPMELRAYRQPELKTPRCSKCGLFRTCKTPYMPTSGLGRKKIFVLGEASGEDEDAQGRQFVGKAGERLRNALRKAGVQPDKDCVFFNALSCAPPGEREPKPEEVLYCRPNVVNAIAAADPDVVLLLGKSAINTVIGRAWREDVGPVTSWVGRKIPGHDPNAWLCPTWHPADVDAVADKDPVTVMLFDRHVAEAVALAGPGKPWPLGLPDYEKSVAVESDPDAAAEMVDTFHYVTAGAVAFDFETNMLKPDSAGAAVAYCSVSDGTTTVAFPWQGAAVKAVTDLIESDLPKVIASAQFEQRWCWRALGCRPRNVFLDTVVAAHCLDNRPGTSSVKFQAFVRLGQPYYAAHMKAYLESEEQGGNAPNRVFQAPPREMMLYCGLDSLLEYEIARQQAGELGLEWPA